jgi:hypothetical protein
MWSAAKLVALAIIGALCSAVIASNTTQHGLMCAMLPVLLVAALVLLVALSMVRCMLLSLCRVKFFESALVHMWSLSSSVLLLVFFIALSLLLWEYSVHFGDDDAAREIQSRIVSDYDRVTSAGKVFWFSGVKFVQLLRFAVAFAYSNAFVDPSSSPAESVEAPETLQQRAQNMFSEKYKINRIF